MGIAGLSQLPPFSAELSLPLQCPGLCRDLPVLLHCPPPAIASVGTARPSQHQGPGHMPAVGSQRPTAPHFHRQPVAAGGSQGNTKELTANEAKLLCAALCQSVTQGCSPELGADGVIPKHCPTPAQVVPSGDAGEAEAGQRVTRWARSAGLGLSGLGAAWEHLPSACSYLKV